MMNRQNSEPLNVSPANPAFADHTPNCRHDLPSGSWKVRRKSSKSLLIGTRKSCTERLPLCGSKASPKKSCSSPSVITSKISKIQKDKRKASHSSDFCKWLVSRMIVGKSEDLDSFSKTPSTHFTCQCLLETESVHKKKQNMLSKVLIKFKTSQRKTAQRGSTFLGPRKSAATPAISVWFAIHASCTCMAKTEAKPRHPKIKWHQFVSPLHIVVCLLHSVMPDLQESNIALQCIAVHLQKWFWKGTWHASANSRILSILHANFAISATSPMILLFSLVGSRCRLSQKIFYGGDLPIDHSMSLQTKC